MRFDSDWDNDSGDPGTIDETGGRKVSLGTTGGGKTEVRPETSSVADV